MQEEKNRSGGILRALLYVAVAGVIFVVGGIIGAAGALALAPNGGDAAGEGPSGAVEIPSPFQYNPDPNAPENVDMQVFWEAWNTINDRFYYDAPPNQDRVYGAIRGMLESLDDPYTAFTDPEVTSILQEDATGNFEGIGAYVEQAQEGGVYIIRVFDEGPADRAGLQAGDIVLAVDGEDVTEKPLNESLLLIRGEAGSEVTLTVFREGEDEPLDITIERGRIEIPTVEYELLEGDIGYVALIEFNQQATPRLQAAVEDLLDQGADSLILDLRDNPGGLRSEAISVADLFIEDGIMMIQRDVDGNVREFTGSSGDLGEDIPMVVLINGNSASASEIVAAAFRDYERAELIGETTFGKGSVQGLYDLSDGSQLRVTIANFYSPDDIEINEVGISPTIDIEDERDPQEDFDAILAGAIDYLSESE
jgi:carboxyl-terminal processing protease